MARGTKDSVTAFGKELEERIKELKLKPAVKAGILMDDYGTPKEGDKEGEKKGPATVGDVALYNEFGTDTIPERSWLRSTVDANSGNRATWLGYAEELRKKMFLAGMKVRQALGLMGLRMEKDLKAKIRSSIPPENAPSTVARKGSDKTLIDTSQMLNAVAHEVVG